MSFKLSTSAVNFHLDHLSAEEMRSALLSVSGQDEEIFAHAVMWARGIGSSDPAYPEAIDYLSREAERSQTA